MDVTRSAENLESQVPKQDSLFPELEAKPLPEDVGYRWTVACEAAGITYRQLDHWARTALLVPSVRPAAGSGSQRLYSFRDILILRIVTLVHHFSNM